MPSKPYLTTDAADRIAWAARVAAAAENAAVTVCVVDAAGHLLRLDRMDRAILVSLRVAEGKARTAVEMKLDTGSLEAAVAAMPSMIAIDGLHPFRGGIPLFEDGHCVAAIGVSGGSPEQDERIGRAAADAFSSTG